METEIGMDYVWQGEGDDRQMVPLRDIPVRLGYRKVHLLRCKAKTEGIIKRGQDEDTTGFYTILAIGPGCRHLTKENIGARIYLPKVGIGWVYPMGRLNHYGQDFNPERIMREEWLDTNYGPPFLIEGDDDE